MENLNQKSIKETIKVLAEEQKVLKNQRKTVHLVGERTMERWQASYRHAANRSELTHLYYAYRLIKGIDIEQVKKEFNNYPVGMNVINKLVEEYGRKVIHTSEQ